MNETKKKACPEFPYWGADYPDARCVGGTLQDLDYCDENGNLYDKGEGVPCPFCRTEEFIEFDPFGWVDIFCEVMEENGDEITDSMEQLAKQKARQAYLDWIDKMKEEYGCNNKKITEKEHFEKCWYKDAEKQTLETLPLFMNHVLNDYQHDYGTICKAIAACGAGAMHAAMRTTHDYISGYQATSINWEILKAWGGLKTHTCAKIINFDDMIFPHNEDRFAKTISKETWDSVQEYAKAVLSEADKFRLLPKMKAHMESIVAGNIPFGYIIKE